MQSEEIYSIFYKIDSRSRMNSAEEFIRTYEEHKEQIESEDNYFYQRIRIEYATTLGLNEEYKRALSLLTKNIELMSKSDFDNPLMVTEGYLKSSRFLKAQSLYYTRNLKEAKIIFSELHKEYPNNDIYKNWLKSSIHWKFQKWIDLLWWNIAIFITLNSILNWFKIKTFEDINIWIVIISFLLIPMLILISKMKQSSK
ncbi:MAG: hypothetical protein ABF242_08280 [Flavobacteriales bacterium]